MTSRAGVFATSVGTKILIGITGLALFIYLIIHIAGNLMVFFGPAVFNKYAYTLEGNPLIPIIEIGLLLIFLVHVYKTVRMFLANQATRPVGCSARTASRTPSEIWSQILSGCPSVTDSEVNRYSPSARS